MHFPIVVEQETPTLWSAYVVGAPVYAQGGTRQQVERNIRATLAAFLADNPDASTPTTAHVVVAAVSRRTRHPPTIALVSPAALVGAHTSARKAASSRANGRLGGRPRKVVVHG